jgi:hypothetical protein
MRSLYIVVLVCLITACTKTEDPKPEIKRENTFFNLATESIITDYAVGDTLTRYNDLSLRFLRKDYDTVAINEWISLNGISKDFVFRKSAISRLMILSGKGDYAGGKEWNMIKSPELSPKLYYPFWQLQDYLSQRILLNSIQYMFIDSPLIISFRDNNRIGIIWIHSLQQDTIVLSYRISL